MPVLFIHPDHKLVGIYKKHLDPYVKIDSAHDGLSGLRKIRLHRPRLIISEYDLPYLSGLTIVRYVRNHKEMFHTPFIFLTNADMPYEALGHGATGWLKQSESGPERLMREIYNNYQFRN